MTHALPGNPRPSATLSGPWPAALEVVSLLALLALASCLAAIGVLSLNACVVLAAILLVAILFLSWRSFQGGRHPCFLFLGMLLIFQGGRLLAFSLGVLRDPMQIDLSTAIPIRISTSAAEITLLIVVLSAILVYAPCRFGYRPAVFRAGREQRWLPALYLLILITFPVALYKNWLYLSFIRAHGGYLSVYTDNSQILQSAGTLVRSLALVNSTALLVAYVFERRPRRTLWILLLYFTLSAFDLLIGFRGKFFTEAIGLWFIHKLKTGKRFNLVPLIAIAIAVSLLAVAIGAFREDQSVRMLSPIGFLAQQGISLNVTEAAVAFRSIFGRYGFNYIWGGFVFSLIHPSNELHHQLWTNDLTIYLNPIAEALGFGTASAYLAELFLAAGIPGVILGSLLIGFALRGLHRASSRAWGAVLLAFALPSVIYLPRLEFLGPLAQLVRAGAGILPVLAFIVVYGWIATLVRMALRRSRSSLPGPDSNSAGGWNRA